MKHNRFISLLLTVIFLFMYNTSYASAAEIKMINGVIQPMITIFNRQKLIECYTEEIRMKAGCSMSQAEKLSEWSPWITPSGLYCWYTYILPKEKTPHTQRCTESEPLLLIWTCLSSSALKFCNVCIYSCLIQRENEHKY